MSERKFSIEDAIRFGWSRMKDNLGFFIIYLILLFLIELFFSGFAGLFEDSLPFLSLVFNIGSWIVSVISALFAVKIGLRLYDNNKIGSYDFLSFSSSLFFKFLLGYVLYIILVVIGFILLVVPGIYLAIKYQFVQYLIVDKDMDVIEAFKESGRLTDGYKWNLLLFAIVLLVVVMIGAMVFLVGLLVAIPIVLVAVAYVYKKLSSDTIVTTTVTQSAMSDSDNPFQTPG